MTLNALCGVIEARYDHTYSKNERQAVQGEMTMVNTITYWVDCPTEDDLELRPARP